MFPIDDKARKAIPIFDGCVAYFPDALGAVATVSKIGNDQHNPGEPLHWARGKSMDHFNTALRHIMDHKAGIRYDADGGRHLAKAAWRVLAALQLDIEDEQAKTQIARSNTPLGEPVSGCVDLHINPQCGLMACATEGPHEHTAWAVGEKLPRPTIVAEQARADAAYFSRDSREDDARPTLTDVRMGSVKLRD
jgi:hypothetical protein